MARLRDIGRKAKIDSQTGFGSQATNNGGRFYNKNGNPNVRKSGIGFFKSISWFHTMLKISRWKFILIVIMFYFTVNLFFATIYYLVGVEHLRGIYSHSELDKFGQAFFFSVQTFTTVGYGHISPNGFVASFVAAVEALIGLLSFAIATGLFYGRFSRPKAFIIFSKNAVIAPFHEGWGLMFRISPHKNTNLSDVEAKITMGISIEENGVMTNKFFVLPLEYEKINALTLSWTLVHPINEESPLFGFTKEDYKTTIGEIIVFIKAFDDTYSTHVLKRSSYTFDEIVYNSKFLPMFTRSEDHKRTILHIDKLNDMKSME